MSRVKPPKSRTRTVRFGYESSAAIQRSGRKFEPWFLKSFGSRPEHKLKPPPASEPVPDEGR